MAAAEVARAAAEAALADGDVQRAGVVLWRWVLAHGEGSGWSAATGDEVVAMDAAMRRAGAPDLLLNVLLETRGALVEAAQPTALARVSQWMAVLLRAQGRDATADALEAQAEQLLGGPGRAAAG